VTARTTRGLRIATRCTSIDQFVAAFHRFCDAQTCFISTLTARPVGLETAFSIDLANAQPALRGMGVVLEAWTTPGNRFGRPGLLLGIRKLTADSEPVFERLLAAHVAATPPPPIQPAQLARPIALPSVMPDGERTPGSELVLPANPLMNISDHSLEGFVDCTLYEETGNFFPAPEPEVEAVDAVDAAEAASIDAVAEPPVLAPRRVTIPPIAEARTATGPMMPITPRTLTGPMTPIAMPTQIAMPVGTIAATPPPLPLARPVVRREIERAASEPFVPVPSAPPMTIGRAQRRPRVMTMPRRRLAVAGGVAVATIAIAIVIASASGHAHTATADSAVPQLVAANLPPPERRAAPVVPHATAVADVVPATATDDSSDTGGSAPMFGSGPCKINVSTTPAGSIISVDGEVAGPSPITIGGPCTKRKLDIAHPRYAPATRIVAATPDAAAVDIALARPTHDLYVETFPAGAAVSIDGHRAGTTPTLVKVMGFTTLSLHIDKFGFKSTTQKIYSKSPHDRVAIKLGH
jgi:PEGA domain